jgi:hypothetical protein
MVRKLMGVALLAALSLGAAAPVRADVVIDWDNVLIDVIRKDRTPPPKASRAMAAVHVAVFDAVVGILGGYSPYHVTESAPADASPEAAAVAAAHQTLEELFPAQQATFDVALAASLGAIPDGAAKTAGVTWGRSVADRILALRANDRSADAVDAYIPLGGLWWTPTPPSFAPAAMPNWPDVTPWCMTKGSQFRQEGPPPPGSAEYTAAFREVYRFGRSVNSGRTAEQTQIAAFWADGTGTATPPGHWLLIAQEVAKQRQLTLLENARLFALLSLAVADAAIVSWDHKYYYNHWRPVTGIQRAELDSNPDTIADPEWTPLILTPPFPAYSSGHSTFSGAAARILELFTGSDAASFTTTSDGLRGVQRSFVSFSQAAEEAGQSRIYGGIHWQYDNKAGLSSGRRLAEHVFFSFLTPVAAPGDCVSGPTALCLRGGRFKVEARWSTGESAGEARVLSHNGDSGQFYFFSADNTELTVKSLDGCSVNERFWFFASGLTDVEVRITVTDTQTGKTRLYFNPRGQAFGSVQDSLAFATCPLDLSGRGWRESAEAGMVSEDR